MSATRSQRYKGTAPYGDSRLDRKTFFGRDRESRALLSLVLAERLVVLFARSGMGKTSLLNAGLVEPLRRRGYFPAVTRVGDPGSDPQVAVIEGVRQAALEAGVDCAGADQASLSAFFGSAEFWSPREDLLRPVLILDQFEELFTLQTPARREELIGELRKLVRDGAVVPTEAGPPRVKVVLSLREDFLANLEELAREIPGVLHNRFRLGPLTRDGAREAILGPARLSDDSFATTPFSYDETAVDRILDFLAAQRRGDQTVATDEVEPFQLQLICQYLEEQVRLQQSRGSEGSAVEVSDSDLRGEGHLWKVLQGFYDRTLAAVTPRSRARAVRRLCEEHLISKKSGRRLPAAEEEIERQVGLSRDELRGLVDARLLRAEVRLGGTFYELSHDTLVGPVRQAREKRRKRLRSRSIAAGLVVAALAWTLAVFYSARAGAPPVVEMSLLPGSIGYLEQEIEPDLLARVEDYENLSRALANRPRIVKLGYRVSGGRFSQARLWVRRGHFGRWGESRFVVTDRRGAIEYPVGDRSGTFIFDLVAASGSGGESPEAGKGSPVAVLVPGTAEGLAEASLDNTRSFTADEWLQIRQRLIADPGGYGLPERLPGTLLVGSFNIRKLGSVEARSEANWDFLAFICRRFDLLTVQEVMPDTEGLYKLKELMGPAFEVIVSTASGGFGVPNLEEGQAFFYDRERVEFTGRVGSISRGSNEIWKTVTEQTVEISAALRDFAEQRERFEQGLARRPPRLLPPVMLGFLRPPFAADFRLLDESGGTGLELTAINAHLTFGRRQAEPRAEFAELMSWIANRMKQRRGRLENVLLLGNVNLTKHQDVATLLEPLAETFRENQISVSFPFTVPHPERGDHFPATVSGGVYGYNQIGAFLRDGALPDNWPPGIFDPQGGLEYGVFDFSRLFSEALLGRPMSELASKERREFRRRFEFTVTDHLPLWVRLPVPEAPADRIPAPAGGESR